jgi:5-(carboxyamino)imidazole ribonucleotide mutase
MRARMEEFQVRLKEQAHAKGERLRAEAASLG